MDTLNDPRRDPVPSPAAPEEKKQLRVLDVPPPFPPALPFKNRAAVAALLASPASSVAWIQGDAGIGKSTLIQEVVEEQFEKKKSLRGAIRIECWPGLRPEELLFRLAEFFSQLGIPDLAEVVLQRTPLAAKLRILFQTLRDHPVWVWLDDFDELLDGSRASEAFTRFTGMGHGSVPWAGKLILTSPLGRLPEFAAGSSSLAILPLQQDELVDREDYWRRCREEAAGIPLPCFADVPPELRRRLLELKVVWAARRWGATSSAGAGLPFTRLSEAVGKIRACLPPSWRAALDWIACYRRPLSKGTLRALFESVPIQDGEEIPLEGLQRFEFVHTGRDDGRFRLHPTVRRLWEEHAKSENLEQWKSRHKEIAQQHLNAALQAQSLWDWYWSYTHFLKAGAVQEAYEIHKSFVEVFLSLGFLDLAKSVLEECLSALEGHQRQVIIGNLAIIYKSEGDHDGALKLYREALEQFASRNDLPNVARVHHQMGNTYYLQGNYAKALNHYETSHEIAVHLGDATVAMLTRVQMANIQFSRQEFDEALKAYLEAMKLATSTGNQLMELALRIQISQIFICRHRYPEAERELLAAEAVALQRDDRRNHLKVLELRGILAVKSRDYAQAASHFLKAEEVAASLGDLAEQANCRIHLGVLAEEKLHYGEALQAYLEARDLLRSAALKTGSGGEGAEAASEVDLGRVQEQLQGIAARLGREAYLRIARNLGRDEAFPGD
ncbi:MAG: tetratricopeptide repeat protein [Planctomycetes bacterium]|nr:tetratricopeptide repeat protein [Planctomycetota bacterium]